MTTQATYAIADRDQAIYRARGLSLAHVAWIGMLLSVLIWGFGGELRKGDLGNTGNWYRIALVLFSAVAGGFALMRNARRVGRALSGPIALLLAYGVFAMVSSLYIPRHSYYSMWKGFEIVVDVVIVAAILSDRAPLESAQRAYRIVVVLFALLTCTAAVEGLLMPSEALYPSRGLIPFTLHAVIPHVNPNALAFMSAIVVFFAGCRLADRARLPAKLALCVLLACALVVLILAQSRTSLIGLAAAAGVYLLASRRFALFAVLAVTGVVIALFTPAADVAQQYIIRGQSNELFASLSGRTRGWNLAWDYFLQSPVFGHGFAAAARSEILGSGGASTLHGAFFDVIVGVGLIGLLLWGIAIGWTVLRLLRVHRASRRSPGIVDLHVVGEMLGIMTLLIVRNGTSSGLAFHEHEFMLFLAIAAFATSARNALRRPAQPLAHPRFVQPARSVS
jgi:O-antigen ligase